MKTKLVNFKTIALAAMVMISPVIGSSQGKLNDLKNKAKEKVGGEKETKTESSSGNDSKTNNNTSSNNKITDSKNIPVTEPTIFMNKKIGSTENLSDFEATDEIFVRVAFPKNVGEAYAETQGMTDVPSTGKYIIAVAKNMEDENPIIMYSSQVFTSRYTKDNMMDFVLQGSAELFKQIEGRGPEIESAYTFNSISTLSPNGLSEEWRRQAAMFNTKKYEWEIMFVFIPYNSDDQTKIKVMATKKFSYNVTAEGKKQLIAGMNDYDKLNFEKTPDDGINTSVHKNNINKIVFSNEKMTKTFDDASKVKTSFDGFSKGIYSRIYLNESMRNHYAEYGKGKDVAGAYYKLQFYVDGSTTPACSEESNLTKEDAHSMTNWMIVFAPLNDDDFKYDAECVNRFAYVMSELEPGKHKIKVVAETATNGGIVDLVPFAEGEFEINITAADRDAFVKKYGLQMPAKGLLEKDAKLLADAKIIAGKEAIDVRCPSGWEERKDAWGVVTHRVTVLAYSYKDENGRCKQSLFMIKQPKTASGWGATNATAEEKTWYGLDPYLPCQNTK